MSMFDVCPICGTHFAIQEHKFHHSLRSQRPEKITCPQNSCIYIKEQPTNGYFTTYEIDSYILSDIILKSLIEMLLKKGYDLDKIYRDYEEMNLDDVSLTFSPRFRNSSSEYLKSIMNKQHKPAHEEKTTPPKKWKATLTKYFSLRS